MNGLRYPDAAAVDVFAEKAETVEWRGRRTLRVENGLVLVKDVAVGDGAVEVDLWAGPGPAYPGIAFRAADELDHELVYVQPHTSGSWDAVQYDPVFNGVNTWQVFNGPRYQAQAEVPSDRWFTLRVDVVGLRAAVTLMEGAERAGGGRRAAPSRSTLPAPALAAAHLVHERRAGRVGVWTYRPAYFAELRVGEAESTTAWSSPAPTPTRPGRAVGTAGTSNPAPTA